MKSGMTGAQFLSLGWFAISSSVPFELKREIELLVFGHHKGP